MNTTIIGYIQQVGEIMDINNQGEITRPQIGMKEPSGDWLVLGAVRYNNFGNQVDSLSFNQLKNINGEWSYKNGKQKWYLKCLDHGSVSIKMSPSHKVSMY